MIFRKAVYSMMTVTLKQKVFIAFSVLSVLLSSSCSQNQAISDGMKNIFLLKPINSTESEWLIKSARESYFLLKSVENKSDANEKLDFVKNYSNFLLKLFKEIQTKETDIHQIFSKENTFLKDYNSTQISEDFDVNEIQSAIEEMQIATERHLVSHYNTSSESFDVLEILTLNETSFDVFLKEKLRADYSEIGYFFLEVFATLLGLSWGIISTALHVARPMPEQ